MSSRKEYSVTVIDRSAAPVEQNKTFGYPTEDPYPTHSMFNLETPFYPITPDVPDQCPECGFHIRMSLKLDHDVFHRALDLLGFRGTDWPSDLRVLVAQRQKLVQEQIEKLTEARKNKRNKKNDQFKGKFLQIVNDLNVAFSVVKMYVEDDFEIGQKPHSSVFVSAKPNVTIPYKSVHSNVLLVATLNEPNLRWQTMTMNTSVFLDDVLSESSPESLLETNQNSTVNRSIQYLGVFSGYNGDVASHLCYAKMHHIFVEKYKSLFGQFDFSGDVIQPSQLESSRSGLVKFGTDNPYCKSIKHCFVETFQRIDDISCMGEDELSSVRWSGVSASVCVFEKINKFSLLHIANSGDNRILACKDGQSVRLSKVHTLSSRAERERVKQKQDSFKYLKGMSKTQATRGIGNYGDQLLRSVVVSTPSCATYLIDEDIEFVLVGSRGLFNVLTESQCIKICKSILPRYFAEIKRHVEELIVSEDEDANRQNNKTVTFESPSRLHQLLESRSKDLESALSMNEDEVFERQEDADRKTENGNESDGSPIVSGVHTPSSSESDSPIASPEKGGKPSESEVFKGLSLQTLRSELSAVSLEGTTEWEKYMPAMARSICEKVCLSAMKNGCKENVSCAIVFLPGIMKKVHIESHWSN